MRLDSIFGPIDGTRGKWPLPRRILPALVLSYACLLPGEMSVDVAGAQMFPYRLVLIALAPVAVSRLVRDQWRPSLVDAWAAFTATWFVIALYWTSTATALVTGTSLFLDFGLAYLVGRVAIRSPQDLRIFFAWFLPGLIAVSAVILLESLSHQVVLRPLVAAALGKPPPAVDPLVRLGLMRAPGPFPHPILAGVFLSLMLPASWLFFTNMRLRIAGTFVAACSFFAVSATSMISLAIAIGLTLIYMLQRALRVPLLLFLVFYAGLALVAFYVLSEGGIMSFVSRRLVLDTGSGYYRQMIWNYAGAEIARNPIFGIGTREWTRPPWIPNSSVDSYWLVMAMYYGLPAAAGSFLVMGGSILSFVGAQRRFSREERPVGAAMCIALSALVISGLSVHIWLSLHAWVIMACGMLVSLATLAGPRPATVAPPPPLAYGRASPFPRMPG